MDIYPIEDPIANSTINFDTYFTAFDHFKIF